jgi:hypothetical protein
VFVSDDWRLPELPEFTLAHVKKFQANEHAGVPWDSDAADWWYFIEPQERWPMTGWLCCFCYAVEMASWQARYK